MHIIVSRWLEDDAADLYWFISSSVSPSRKSPSFVSFKLVSSLFIYFYFSHLNTFSPSPSHFHFIHFHSSHLHSLRPHPFLLHILHFQSSHLNLTFTNFTFTHFIFIYFTFNHLTFTHFLMTKAFRCDTYTRYILPRLPQPCTETIENVTLPTWTDKADKGEEQIKKTDKTKTYTETE